jgi:diguanylate cyclase (GGDEF)-like protein
MSENSQEKQRLLIVDDSKVIRVTARKILRDHFETIEAVDGEDAWEMLTGDEPFALIVSDLTMPRLDGFGLLKRIRSSHLPHIRELPVIIITGSNDSEAAMQRAREAGATDFIGKPFDAVHLLARTQAHASSHATANALREEKAALEDQSTVDSTTGLCNEESFMERGYQQLSYAIRHNTTLAMFRIEIDNFGELYRQYGEAFTASVIRAMGNTLRSSVREEDTAARIGTARFALLLPGMGKTGIRTLAQRIHQSFSSRRFMAGKKSVQVTVSIGVGAPDIRRNYRFDELLTITHMHLNQAMAQGGNRIVYEAVPTPPAAEEPLESAQPSPGTIEPEMAEPFLAKIPLSPARDRMFLEQDADVEEIELYPAETSGTGTKPGRPGVSEIGRFAPDAPDPLPGKFTGPVPGHPAAPSNKAPESGSGNAGSETGTAKRVTGATRVAVAAAEVHPGSASVVSSATNPDGVTHQPETPGQEAEPATRRVNDPLRRQFEVKDPGTPVPAPTRRGLFRTALGLFLRRRSRR